MSAKFLISRLFLLVFLFSFSQVKAEKVYVLFNENCMDKLEYKPTTGKAPYMVYQVKVGNGDYIVLDVGQESTAGTKELPIPFIGCYNGEFDLQLVNKINANINEYYMVVEKGNKYYITPIQRAALYKYIDEQITYISPEYSFQFHLVDGVIGENLSYKDRSSKVYFQGRLENECLGNYIFRQTPRRNNGTFTDIKLIPEIGIVEIQAGSTAGPTGQAALTLYKVNNQSLSRFIKNYCNTEDTGIASFDPTNVSHNSDVTPKVAYVATDEPNVLTPKEYVTPSTVVEKGPEVHTVKRGETLYAISRKYDVSVNQIKSWNNKRTNVINPGEKLMVSAPVETTTPSTAYRNGLTEKSGSTSTAIKENYTNKYYIVKRGDTPASIALKHGYTESRFRQMNGLSENQFIKVGQRVKVSDCQCESDGLSFGKKSTNNAELKERTLEPVPYSSYSVSNYNTSSSNSNQPISYEAPASSIPSFDNYQPSSYSTTPNQPSTTSRNTPKISYYDTPVPTSSPNNAYNRSTYNEPINYPTYDAGFDNENEFTTKSAEPVEYRAFSSAKKNNNRTVYIVKEGDNLYRIARKFGVRVEELRKLNNLEVNEVIIPFQKIYIN